MPVIRFLADENVPLQAVEYLRARGHEVTLVGEVLAKSSPDALLVTAAELEGLVVITFDRDFKRLIQQMPEGSRRRFNRKAGRISLTCKEHEVRDRLEDQIEVIEFHYARAQARNKRFIMQLSLTSATISD